MTRSAILLRIEVAGRDEADVERRAGEIVAAVRGSLPIGAKLLSAETAREIQVARPRRVASW